jgi:hypothetical protein
MFKNKRQSRLEIQDSAEGSITKLDATDDESLPEGTMVDEIVQTNV